MWQRVIKIMLNNVGNEIQIEGREWIPLPSLHRKPMSVCNKKVNWELIIFLVGSQLVFSGIYSFLDRQLSFKAESTVREPVKFWMQMSKVKIWLGKNEKKCSCQWRIQTWNICDLYNSLVCIVMPDTIVSKHRIAHPRHEVTAVVRNHYNYIYTASLDTTIWEMGFTLSCFAHAQKVIA